MVAGQCALKKPSSPALSPGGEREPGTELLAQRIVWGGFAIYALVYTAMNWGLWFNMRIPHGDSAMYEEHLWNVWHGKGFRSYLDQGLFLGEHIQVIHLLLLPLHMLWPSHLLLELCQSLVIGATVFPVYSIARRHTDDRCWRRSWADGLDVLSAALSRYLHRCEDIPPDCSGDPGGAGGD